MPPCCKFVRFNVIIINTKKMYFKRNLYTFSATTVMSNLAIVDVLLLCTGPGRSLSNKPQIESTLVVQ